MITLELIDILRNDAGITKSEAARVIKIFLGEMGDALSKGDRVEIRGLCSFYVKKYKGYTGRNPRTWERIKVKRKKLPFFKCGKELRDRVDHQKT